MFGYYLRTASGNRTAMGVAVAVVIFLVWNTGMFDKVLRNLITGAVFCGDELDEIRDRERSLRRELRGLR